MNSQLCIIRIKTAQNFIKLQFVDKKAATPLSIVFIQSKSKVTLTFKNKLKARFFFSFFSLQAKGCKLCAVSPSLG